VKGRGRRKGRELEEFRIIGLWLEELAGRWSRELWGNM
jgi:hypothetical protein